MRRLSAAAVAGLALTALPAAPASAAETEDPSCASVMLDTTPVAQAKAESETYRALNVAAAHQALDRQGVQPGAGVRVAVVDSGIRPMAGLPVAQQMLPLTPVFFQGTAVAGLIAGAPRADGKPVGIAPAASLIDVRVYDSLRPQQEGELPPAADRVAGGLEWLASQPGLAHIVAVPVRVGPDDRMKAAVERLWQQGTVVVAASGDRPTDDQPDAEAFATYDGDEDAAASSFPAGYDKTVAVSATAPDGVDVTATVLANSATDVAAPTVGAVSYALNGGTCVIDTVSTAWATAEVAGVLALIKSAHPRDTAAQLVTRLVRTASGRDDVRGRFLGAGVVQPAEAVTRPLRPAKDGSVEQTVPEPVDVRAEAPPRARDVLAGTRSAAVWWGLAGGGALLLALLLRPVLTRRR